MALNLVPTDDRLTQAVVPGTNFAEAAPTSTGWWMCVFLRYASLPTADDDILIFEKAGHSGNLWRIRADIMQANATIQFASRYATGPTRSLIGKAISAGSWHFATIRTAAGSTNERTDDYLWVDGEAVVSGTDVDRYSVINFSTNFDTLRVGSTSAGCQVAGVAWGTGDPASFHAWVYNGGDFREPSGYDFNGDAGCTLEGYWPFDLESAETVATQTEAQDAVGALDTWTVVSGASFDAEPAPFNGEAEPIGDDGELLAPVILANGRQATIDLAGMDSGSLTATAGDVLTGVLLNGTSEGYSSTTGSAVTTKSRTGIRCKFNSATTITGGCRVTLDLDEPWHDDCTSITLTAPAGAFDDGTFESLAATDLAVTNNSTLDYATPAVSLIAPTTLSRETGSVTVEVIAMAGAYKGYRSNFGIARIEVEATDNGGAGTTVIKGSTAPVLVARRSASGLHENVLAWTVTFDLDADWTGPATDNALVRFVAKAYPSIGDADSVRADSAKWIFADPDNDYDVRHAVVDPTSGNDTTGRIATGDGSAGLDATALANPYATIHKAISELQRGDGITGAQAVSKASYSIVYLVEDDHVLGTYSAGDVSNTSDGPIIITRVPGTTKANVKIVGSADSNGLRTIAYNLRDLTIELGASGQIRTGSAASGTAGPLGNVNILILEDTDMVGPGRGETMSRTPIGGFTDTFRVGGTLSEIDVPAILQNARDFTVSQYSGDIKSLANALNQNMVNFRCTGGDPDGTDTHVDIVQANGDIENLLIWQYQIDDSNQVQLPFFGNGGVGTHVCTSIGYFGGIGEADGQATRPQFDDLEMESWFWYHNSIDEAPLFTEDNDGFTQNNVWFGRNYLAGIGVSSSPATHVSGFFDNHLRVDLTQFPETWDETVGGSLETLFVDWAGGDYAANPDGPLVDRGYTDPISPFYADGTPIPTDGSGGVGAVGAEADEPEPDPGLELGGLTPVGFLRFELNSRFNLS